MSAFHPSQVDNVTFPRESSPEEFNDFNVVIYLRGANCRGLPSGVSDSLCGRLGSRRSLVTCMCFRDKEEPYFFD